MATKEQATDINPNPQFTQPEFVDFRGTEDHKTWKELGLKLCPKCRHKPLTSADNTFICANGLPDCEGIKLWQSIHEKPEDD